jgi:Ketopantoate hydroxymethyltransferase
VAHGQLNARRGLRQFAWVAADAYNATSSLGAAVAARSLLGVAADVANVGHMTPQFRKWNRPLYSPLCGVFTGHVGLVPNLATWTSFRAVGKTPTEAIKLVQAVRDLENAGAACVEVEVVPVRIADYISRHTTMITMGMGCGSACDTQYLFSSDVLGADAGHYPGHAKRYADFIALEADLQVKWVAAFGAFATDVTTGAYPEPGHQIDIDDATFEQFIGLVER